MTGGAITRETAETADHQDSMLIAELSTANTHTTRYILRHLDADARRVEPTSIEVELELAARLEGAAMSLRQRAARRRRAT